MTCGLGLECDYKTCPNYRTCDLWCKPWQIPYKYVEEDNRLDIQTYYQGYRHPDCVKLGFFEDQEDLNLTWEWLNHGFAQALPLPYYHYIHGGISILSVHKDLGDFRKPWPIPYYYQEMEGFPCLTVSHSIGPWEIAQSLEELPF